MKNAILLHGVGGNGENFWFPYIKTHLQEKGYTVWNPTLPDPNNPQLDIWLSFVTEHGTFNEETIIIGHSASNPIILALLENLSVKIKQVILVAAFFEPVHSVTGVLKSTYDWEAIKSHVEDLIIINSDNDPWKCDDQQGLQLFHHLGGTLIIRHGEGHMGSESFNQPYKEFPLLLKLIA